MTVDHCNKPVAVVTGPGAPPGEGLVTRTNEPEFGSALPENLSLSLQQADASAQDTALLVLRINEFRELCETLGAEFGAELARQVEARLRNCLRMCDVAERVGHDEFAIVLGRLGKLQDVNLVANRLVESCSGSYQVGDLAMHVKAAVGIALYRPGGEEGVELLRYARIALRGVDQDDLLGCHFFTRELLERQQRAVWMEAELERALSQDRFVLHYQPQYHASSRQIVGLEALVRMRSETGELIPPDDFIPLAESNGFIVRLGRWVIMEACRQLAQWRSNGCGPVRMAVNVSPQQLLQKCLPAIVDEAIEANGLAYPDLELEITEQPMLEFSVQAANVLKQLRSRGVRIAVDDFGTGYSSLAYLSHLPLDIIKMDRSFMVGVPDNERAVRVAAAMIVMARELGYEIIVEGVETPAQRQFLLNSGCELGQGFGLARPQEADAIEKLLLEPNFLRVVGETG